MKALALLLIAALIACAKASAESAGVKLTYIEVGRNKVELYLQNGRGKFINGDTTAIILPGHRMCIYNKVIGTYFVQTIDTAKAITTKIEDIAPDMVWSKWQRAGSGPTLHGLRTAKWERHGDRRDKTRRVTAAVEDVWTTDQIAIDPDMRVAFCSHCLVLPPSGLPLKSMCTTIDAQGKKNVLMPGSLESKEKTVIKDSDLTLPTGLKQVPDWFSVALDRDGNELMYRARQKGNRFR